MHTRKELAIHAGLFLACCMTTWWSAEISEPGSGIYFAGTLMGRGCYEQIKRLLGRGRSVAPATACAGRIG